MMLYQDSSSADDAHLSTEAKNATVELLKFKEGLSGARSLYDEISKDNPLSQMQQTIVDVDSTMRKIVNQMGQGGNLAQSIKINIADAALDIVKAGGKFEDAGRIMQETSKVYGRNITLSSEQTEKLFYAEKATGEAAGALVEGFRDAGMSLKDINKGMTKVLDVSNALGVNAKGVSKSVVENLDKLNRYGFQGGIEGLARMAAKAQTLGVSMSKTFDLADKLMSPESAIELSSALQRLGATSTDLIDPLKLMDLAQNNVPELQKQLGDMFKTYTFFDEKTKSFQIMPSARRQLKEIAGELGMDIKEVERMALGTADLDKKLSQISFSGFDVDQDTKELVANMAMMDEKGDYKIQTEEIGADGKPVSKSIQEVMERFGGDSDKIREYLTGLQADKEKTVEDKTYDVAVQQLDALNKILSSGAAVKLAPGLAASTSKFADELFATNQLIADTLNEPLIKNLGPGSEFQNVLNNVGTTIGESRVAIQTIVDEAITKGEPVDFEKIFAKAGELGITITKDLKDGFEQIFQKIGIDLDKLPGLDDIKKKIPKGEEEDGEQGTAPGIDDIKKKAGKEEDGEQGTAPGIDNIKKKKGEQETAPGTSQLIGKDIPLTITTNEVLLTELQQKPLEFPNIETINAARLEVEDSNFTDNLNALLEKNQEPLVTENTETKGKPFEPLVGPPIVGIGGTEGMDLNQFKPLNEIEGFKLQTPVPTPTIQPEGVESTDRQNGILNELKVEKSNIGILNVENLNLGTALDVLVSKIKPTDKEESLVGKQSMTQGGPSVPKPVVTPVVTPTIDINAGLPEEEKKPIGTTIDKISLTEVENEEVLSEPDKPIGIKPEKTVQEAQQNQLDYLEELRQKEISKPKKEKGKFNNILQKGKSIEPEEPSVYENYKKLLEEINNSEVVGQGEEAFFLTPEMKAQSKKDSEFIGDVEPSGDLKPTPTPNKVETKPIGADMGPGEFNLRAGMAFGNIADLKDWEKTYPEAYNKINKEASFGRLPGETFELPELTKEQEDIMLGGYIPTKQTTKLEEKYYDMKSTEGRGEIKKFEEEKLAAAKLEGKDTMNDEDLDILKSMKARTRDYEDKGLAINTGEVDSFTKKIEPIGLDVKPKLAPMKPTLSQIPIPEEEEKQPLGKRLKEGIGEIKQKLKGKKEKDTMNDEDLDILKSMKARTRDYEDKGLAINTGEVDSFTKKIEPIGLDVKPKLAPMKPTLSQIPIPEEEEKQPLGKRLKEGIGEIKQKLKGKKEKDTRSVLEKISLTKDEDEGIIEPVEPTGIKPVEPKETEIQKALRENREKQLSYLEELTLKEQTPETPARGIEKFAGKIGGIKEKLFEKSPSINGIGGTPSDLGKYIAKIGTKKETPTTTQPELELPNSEYDVSEVPAEQDVTPSPYNGGGLTSMGEREKGAEKGTSNELVVGGGSPINVVVTHNFNGLPSTIDTNQLKILLGRDNTIAQAVAQAVKGVGLNIS